MAATKSSNKAEDKAPAGKPKAASSKTTAVKAASKPAAKKQTSTRTRKTSSAKPRMSPEERYRMVEVAAYYIAERNQFAGNPVEYWTQAEIQISSMLGE
jgi:hypothetical protein